MYNIRILKDVKVNQILTLAIIRNLVGSDKAAIVLGTLSAMKGAGAKFNLHSVQVDMLVQHGFDVEKISGTKTIPNLQGFIGMVRMGAEGDKKMAKDVCDMILQGKVLVC